MSTSSLSKLTTRTDEQNAIEADEVLIEAP